MTEKSITKQHRLTDENSLAIARVYSFIISLSIPSTKRHTFPENNENELNTHQSSSHEWDAADIPLLASQNDASTNLEREDLDNE